MAINVGTGVITVLPDLSQFRQSLEKDFTSKVANFGQATERLGRSLIPLSVAAGGLFAAGIKGATDFEAGLAKIEALVGETEENLRGLSQGVKDLAGATGRGPQELVDALFFVESAGLRGNEALQTLTESARLSAAGLGETKDIADALTSALNAYALSGLTAAEASDVLVATVREGKIETDTLARSIGRVIPIASQLGVEFSEVGAAIAASTKVGLSAEEATTALRQALVTILKPSAEAAATLQQYGFSADELRKKVRDEGLLSTLQELRDTFGEDADATNRVFQNVRALTGIFALVGENAQQVQQVFDAVANSTGDADKAFETVAKTTQFKLNVALAEFKVALIELGDLALPVVQFLADAFAGLARTFSTLPGPIKNLIGSLLGITVLAAPVLLLVGRFTQLAVNLRNLRGLHLGAAAAASTHGAALQGLSRAATSVNLVPPTTGLRGAFQRLSVPSSILGRAASGLGIALGGQLLSGLAGGIRTREDTLADTVKTTLTGALNLAGIGAGIGFTVGGPVGAAIGGLGGAVIGGLTSFISNRKNDVQDQIEDTLTPRPQTFNALFQAGRQAANSIRSAFQETFNLSETVDEELLKVRDSIRSAVDEAQEGIADVTRGQVTDFLEDPFKDVRGTDDQLFDQLQRNLEHVREHNLEIQTLFDELGSLGLIGIQNFAAGLDPAETLSVLRAVRAEILNDPAGVFQLNRDILNLTPDLEAAFDTLIGAIGLTPADRNVLGVDAEFFRQFFDALTVDRPDLVPSLLALFERLELDEFAAVLQQEFELTLNPVPIVDEDQLVDDIERVFSPTFFKNFIEDTALQALLGPEGVIRIGPAPTITGFEIDQNTTVDNLISTLDNAIFGPGGESAIQSRLRAILLEVDPDIDFKDPTKEQREAALIAIRQIVFPDDAISFLETEIQGRLEGFARDELPELLGIALQVDPSLDKDNFIQQLLEQRLGELTVESINNFLSNSGFADRFLLELSKDIVEDPNNVFSLRALPDIIQEGLADPVIVDRIFGTGNTLGFDLSTGAVAGFNLAWQTDAQKIQNIIDRTRFTVSPQIVLGADPGRSGQFNQGGNIVTFNFGDINSPGGADTARAVEETVSDSAIVRAIARGGFRGN